MEEIKILNQVNNLEIISKLMNSVAKQCNCRVKYNAEDQCIKFYGDEACQKYIVEETLSFFSEDGNDGSGWNRELAACMLDDKAWLIGPSEFSPKMLG